MKGMGPGEMGLREAVEKIKAEAAANGETISNAQAKKRLWAGVPKPVRAEATVNDSKKNIRRAIDAYAAASGIPMNEFVRAKLVGIARGYQLTETELTPQEERSVRAVLAGLPTLGKRR